MSEYEVEIPAHVPEHLVRYDYPFAMGVELSENPFDEPLKKIHQGPEMIFTSNAYPVDVPAWVPRTRKLLEAIYLDTEHFSSAGFSPFAMLVGESWNLVPAEIDPPHHSSYRALLTPMFTPKRMRALEGQLRETARELIAEFKDRGECEFMEDFALRFPIVVFLDLMGLPREKMDQFLTWENMLFHSGDFGSIIEATKGVTTYLRTKIEERRKEPLDDIISMAVTSEINGEKLNDDDVMGLCFNFYVGGLDTVTTNLGWQIRHLAEHPEDQQYLRDNPDKISTAIECMYRRYAAVTTFRTCTKEIELGGATIMPGDKVAMSTTLANTDPAAWDAPFEMSLDKPPRHLTFGFGIHRCAGAALARLEANVAIEELLAALPQFRTKEGEDIITSAGPILQLKNVPLTWKT